MWSKLPQEIIHHVLAYHGTVHYCLKTRQYINRIHKHDPRYAMVAAIPIMAEPRVPIQLEEEGTIDRHFTFLVRFSVPSRLLVITGYAYSQNIQYTFINKGDKQRIRVDEFMHPYEAP